MIGLILAGGRARRLNGLDKALLTLGADTLLARTIAALRPTCRALVLNANGDARRFMPFGLPVVSDDGPDFAGPLAGIVAGLDHVAAHYPRESTVVTVPADAPFLPADLVARLSDHRAADIVYASSGGRDHPVIALWPVALRADLRRALATDGLRRMRDVLARHTTARVEWPIEPVDPFFNVNTPDDLDAARRILAARP